VTKRNIQRQKASRGLSTTAELLVSFSGVIYETICRQFMNAYTPGSDLASLALQWKKTWPGVQCLFLFLSCAPVFDRKHDWQISCCSDWYMATIRLQQNRRYTWA